MPLPAAALVPAIKALAAGGAKKAALGLAKKAAVDTAKGKAKDFVTGKGRKKKGKKGKGGALVKSEGRKEERSEGGAIVATTPMVGSYRVETGPQKPDLEGEQTKVNFESINNQLDSIIGLTNVLKQTSQVKLKTAENKKKAERKAAEKAKKRQRESLLEKGAGVAGKIAGNLYGKATEAFDPLKFFAMIFLGSLLMWIMNNGSKITAFLKATLALMNNLGKVIKAGIEALGKAFKFSLKALKNPLKTIKSITKGVKNLFKNLGPKLGKAIKSIGKGLLNVAKNTLKRIKDLGKFMMNPFGGKKPPKGSPKGIEKAAKTASKSSKSITKAGRMSNDARRVLKKHGPEAAERFQRLVDKGMDPAKASRRVNKAIKAGKIVSKPGKAVATGAASQVAKKAGQKGILSVAKGGLGLLKRIPVVGSLITLVVSLLSGDPVTQALFKTGGAAIGGFLGSFIPIPVVGTLFGEIVGEYIGDLTYVAMKGGGMDAVGEKLKEDLDGLLSMGANAMKWVGNGFTRLYEGLPKIGFGKLKAPNPVWLVNPFNFMEKLGLFHTAFFTDKPVKKGKFESSNNETNYSDVTRDATGQRAGDFVVASDGSLSVYDGLGFDDPTPEQRKLYLDGAKNIDGTGAQATLESRSFQSAGGYYSTDTRQFLGKTEGEAKAKLTEMGIISQSQSARPGEYKAILDLISSVEAPSYDTINSGHIDGLSKMTIAGARRATLDSGVGSGAMGRYQQMPAFVLDRARSIGLDPDVDLFSPENQDKLAILLIDGAGYKKWKAGKMTKEKFAYNLAGTWRGLPEGPSNLTYQDQYAGRNKAHTTWANVMRVLGGAQVQPQTSAVPKQLGITDPPAADRGSVTPAKTLIPENTGTKLGGLSGHSGSVAYNGQQQASLSVSYSPFSQSDITSQGMQIISGKGYRASTNSVHKGFDIPSVEGTPVYAYLPGEITMNKRASGYGNIVEWKDNVYGEKHLFAHLMAPSHLKVGDTFSAGTMLAKTGDTGTPGSYHLHWEIGGQGSEKDPAAWVASHPNKGEVTTQPVDGHQAIQPSQVAVRPSSSPGPGATQAQAVSSQLPYERSGGQTIMMMTHPSTGNGPSIVGGGSRTGTPVMMGSGDVVNSYYKAQLLGFLYKQG